MNAFRQISVPSPILTLITFVDQRPLVEVLLLKNRERELLLSCLIFLWDLMEAVGGRWWGEGGSRR